MKKIFILFIAITMLSCKKELKEQIKDSVSLYVTNNFKEYEVSSFDIVKIDTITPKFKYDIAATEVYNELQLRKADFDMLKDVYETSERILNTDPYNQEYIAHHNEAKKTYLKTENEVMPKVALLQKFAEVQKTADSTTFLAYDIRGIVSYTNNENVTKTDSIYLILNKDMKIIEKKDFINDYIK